MQFLSAAAMAILEDHAIDSYPFSRASRLRVSISDMPLPVVAVEVVLGVLLVVLIAREEGHPLGHHCERLLLRVDAILAFHLFGHPCQRAAAAAAACHPRLSSFLLLRDKLACPSSPSCLSSFIFSAAGP